MDDEIPTIDAVHSERSEWQPIETAPKDGTVIDLWIPGWERFADCHWSKIEPAGWTSDFGDVVLECTGNTEPTHWMPLPEPPTSSV
jgi:hypothetical protein